jgi:hypothetical protein
MAPQRSSTSISESPNMAKMRKKADLPNKICPVCARPFTWRKKWAKAWPAVVYCSDRCRRSSRVAISPASK